MKRERAVQRKDWRGEEGESDQRSIISSPRVQDSKSNETHFEANSDSGVVSQDCDLRLSKAGSLLPII